MHETPEDLRQLQDLLDCSFASQGEHMRSLITPDRRITATELAGILTGMRLLSLATVTRDGRPRNAPVDGFFFRGAWWFGSAPHSLRMRHIRERPDVSATHLDGERLGIMIHGTAEIIDQDSAAFTEFFDCVAAIYGDWWPKQMAAWREEWGEPAPYARIAAERMHIFASREQIGLPPLPAEASAPEEPLPPSAPPPAT
ncbi:MAG: pyridoxamine 5'-phosphate oxidase family protein [Thermomicrobiales bacterium]